MERSDHLASDNPESFRSYVKDIQNVLVMLGDAKKTPTEKELQMREKLGVKRVHPEIFQKEPFSRLICCFLSGVWMESNLNRLMILWVQLCLQIKGEPILEKRNSMETEMRYSSLVCANVDVSNCTIEETDLCANSLLKFTSNGIDTLFCLNDKGTGYWSNN